MTFSSLLVLAIAIETRGGVKYWAPAALKETLENCENHKHPEEMLGPLAQKAFDRYLKDWGVEKG